MSSRSKRPRKHFKYTKMLIRMQKKLWFVFGVFCILSIILIIRMMYINYTKGAKYEKIVLAQQDYDSKIIPYQRGDIIDSKGTVMATSVDVYNVILDCKVLNANDKKIETTIKALLQCFPEISEDTIRTALKDAPDSSYKILAKRVSYDEMNTMQTMMDDKETGKTIAGVWFEKEYIRQYPYGSLGASVLGFTTSGNNGVLGLENEYNTTLNGTNGRSYGYVNEDSDVQKTVVDVQDGNTIVSTIDVNVQSIVEQAIQDFNNQMVAARQEEAGGAVAENAFDIKSANQGSANTAVVVMNPKTGEILAMADYPGFDLNDPRSLTAWFTEEQIAGMSDEEQLNLLNQLWNNFAVSSTYEPGSTFKPFVVGAGLDTGSVNGDETYFCDGAEMVDGFNIHCVKHEGHGTQTIAQVLSNSCNDAMMQMALKQIGPDNLSDYQARFGFGQLTGIDLPGEARTNGLLYSKEQLEKTKSSLATNAFGQNFNVTMIQMASAFSALVNGGDYYQPHVVSAIQDSEGNVVQTITPNLVKKTVSAETSAQIREYLKYVVTDGSGKFAAVENYSIGGKTGTAEKVPRGRHNYLVSFIGAAPIEDPEVVVYCIVDEPNTNDQAHSTFAQSIVQNIMTQILPYLDVPTTDEQAQAAAEAAAAQAAESGVDTQITDEAAESTETPEAVPGE